jgi:ABC-type dipeptide/oligopeptide/nickel transport system permease component
MGLVLMSAVLIVLSNLLADLAYAVADPRIRYE